MTVRFVNTAADSGGDGTTNNTSSGDGTHAYDDLETAEAGEQADLTASESLIFQCTGTADSSRVTFALADWTVNASNFITIEPQAADRHGKSIDTAKYHKTTVANYRHGIENLVDFTVIDGIQILLNNAFTIGVDFGGCIDVVVKNCIVQGDGSSSQQRGVEHNNPVAAGQFTAVNNVVFDCSTRGIGQLQYDADLVIVYYNNTVDSCGTGIQMGSVHDAASRIFNNIATNNTTDYSLSGSFTSGDNLSSDTTSPETAHQSKTVTYTNAAGGDFSTSDADVVTLGTDLTSDSLFPFDTDCILVDRATSWDLGAFQEAASGAFTLIADTAQYAYTGTAAGLLLASVLVADTEQYTYSGTTTDLIHGRNLTADTAQYTYSGTAADLIFAGAGSFTLVADTGAYAYTGTAAELLHDSNLIADSGPYAYTGTNVNIIHNITLTADSGAYTYAGTAADLKTSRIMISESGSYIITGTAATLSASGQIWTLEDDTVTNWTTQTNTSTVWTVE